jgi:cysteinyl-tRNA synthetase
MLRLAGEKMSKSLGNIVSLREALDTWGRETLLVYFLGGHWRKPIDYSDEVLQQARAQAESFRNVFRGPSETGGDWEAFAAALDDDFNTPEALAVMHGWRDHDLLRRALEVFGLESLAASETAPAGLEELARARAEARAQKDFATSDRLRDEIAAAGWDVRDVDAEPGFQLVPKR